MTGNSDAAEDIAQETFTQVLLSFDKYKGDSQIYTWIYAIAKNICFRYLNNSKKKSFYTMEELIDDVRTKILFSIREQKFNIFSQKKLK